MRGDSCYEGGHSAYGGSPQSPPLGKTLLCLLGTFFYDQIISASFSAKIVEQRHREKFKLKLNQMK